MNNDLCYTYDIFSGYTSSGEIPYNYSTAKAAMSLGGKKINKGFTMKGFTQIVISGLFFTVGNAMAEIKTCEDPAA